jgi:hypothetical protein
MILHNLIRSDYDAFNTEITGSCLSTQKEFRSVFAAHAILFLGVPMLTNTLNRLIKKGLLTVAWRSSAQFPGQAVAFDISTVSLWFWLIAGFKIE